MDTPYTGEAYKTAGRPISAIARLFPSLAFYAQNVSIVIRASRKAKRGVYTDEEWAKSSWEVLRALESVGVRLDVAGLDHIRSLDGPAVFIGNHMSMLETFILPGVVQPIRHVTFVVKQALLDYPVFCHVMRSRNPVAVGRTNPREDLKAVLNGGIERLNNGVSIIVFPQTTRSQEFDPGSFNSIGVKLAQRAGVPVVPIALKSDAWQNGAILKDFGKIDPARKVHFAFGEPMSITRRGNEEHAAIVEFIGDRLASWKLRPPAN